MSAAKKTDATAPELVAVISRRSCLSFVHVTGEAKGDRMIVPELDVTSIRFPPGVSFHRRDLLDSAAVGKGKLCPFAQSGGGLRVASLDNVDTQTAVELVAMTTRPELIEWAKRTDDPAVLEAIEDRLKKTE